MRRLSLAVLLRVLLCPGVGAAQGIEPIDDTDYLWWPLPDGASEYAAIDGYRIKALTNEVVAISRRARDEGDPYWGRVAGTKYDQQTQDWLEAHFRRIGLHDVRQQQFDLSPQWVPRSWSISLTAGDETFELTSAWPAPQSAPTPLDGTELEPVWLSLGTTADFIGRDVTGKAAIILALPQPSGRRNSANYLGSIRRAKDRGAAAVVVVVGIPGNVAFQLSRVEGPVPTMAIGLEDGVRLRELIGRGRAPRVRLRLQTGVEPGLTSGNVWGVLPGQTDENVLVVAHLDGQFDGALDNASGMAGLGALAEFYAARPAATRRRTMTFVGLPAHHAVSQGALWIRDNMRAFLRRTALVVNMEHLSHTQTYSGAGQSYAEPNGMILANTVSARRWFVGGTDRLRDLVLDSFQTFGVSIYTRPEPRPGGELGRFSTHAPSVHIIDHTYYHSDLDIPELVPASGLEAATRAFAKIIDEVNELSLADVRGGLFPRAPAARGQRPGVTDPLAP